MKSINEFDGWIDRSIARLMKITDQMNETDDMQSPVAMKQEPYLLPLPPHAEASDFFSINDWLEPHDGSPDDHEW